MAPPVDLPSARRRWKTKRVRRTEGRARRIVLANRKGGAGKTTSAVEVAYRLASWGLRVRLWDGDAQLASVTSWIPPVGDGWGPRGPSLADVYSGDATLAEVTAPTGHDSLFVVPSYKSLGMVEKEASPGTDVAIRQELDRADADGSGFDVEMLDCPGALGQITASFLAAADDLWVPLQNSYLDFLAQAELMDFVHRIQARLNPNLTTTAVLVVNADGQTTLSRDLREQLGKDHAGAHVVAIPHSVRAAEAPKVQQPIALYAPDNPVSDAYWLFAEDMLPRLELETVEAAA